MTTHNPIAENQERKAGSDDAILDRLDALERAVAELQGKVSPGTVHYKPYPCAVCNGAGAYPGWTLVGHATTIPCEYCGRTGITMRPRSYASPYAPTPDEHATIGRGCET